MPRLFSPKVLIAAAALLILDMSIAPIFHSGFFRPVFLYVLILYACFEWHWSRTLPMALAVGFLRGALTSGPFGPEILSLLLVSFLLSLATQKASIEFWPLRIAAGFFFIFFTLLISSFFEELWNTPSMRPWYRVGVIFWSALITVIFMPFFFSVLERWFHDRSRFRHSSL